MMNFLTSLSAQQILLFARYYSTSLLRPYNFIQTEKLLLTIKICGFSKRFSLKCVSRTVYARTYHSRSCCILRLAEPYVVNNLEFFFALESNSLKTSHHSFSY